MAHMLFENGVAVLAFARQATLAFLEDIPEDKLCYCAVPGSNHAMWLIGHLALTDVVVRHDPEARGCPEGWDKLFGQGSEPIPDASAYPSLDEMKAQLSARREDVIAWFGAMDEARLLQALPAERQGFAPNYAGLMCTLAYHEGLHAGQLRVIGQALGKPPKFG